MTVSLSRAVNIANMACQDCPLFAECEEREVACGAWDRLLKLAKAGRINAKDLRHRGERRKEEG